jgi:exonuclease VII large subunit
VGITDQGAVLDEIQCRRLFDLSGQYGLKIEVPLKIVLILDTLKVSNQKNLLEELTGRNARWFDIEMEKLEKWAEDRRNSLKVELEELDQTVKETRKAARLAPNLPEKLERQRELRKLETKRDTAWREYDQSSRELDHQKDSLLDEISQRLNQQVANLPLFILRWEIF